jgi:hypothetical protein
MFTGDRFVPGDGWGRGIGADPGAPVNRPGHVLRDLERIRPIHWAGVFTAHEEEVIFTGLLNVASISGSSAQVTAQWGPVYGGGWFNGNFFITTPERERGDDPLAHFTPLTLTASGFEAVPEPSALALLGTALVGVARWSRKRRFTRTRS